MTQQPRQQPMSADALVIGAGVVGSSIALQLARAGLAVTVLDRNRAVGAGSTSASSAVVRFHYSTRAGVVTSWESKFGWERWGESGFARRLFVGWAHGWCVSTICVDAPRNLPYIGFGLGYAF